MSTSEILSLITISLISFFGWTTIFASLLGIPWNIFIGFLGIAKGNYKFYWITTGIFSGISLWYIVTFLWTIINSNNLPAFAYLLFGAFTYIVYRIKVNDSLNRNANVLMNWETVGFILFGIIYYL